MINSPAIYFECGRKTAEARQQRDEARARFQGDWFNRAKRLETTADRQIAESEFSRGYRSLVAPQTLQSR